MRQNLNPHGRSRLVRGWAERGAVTVLVLCLTIVAAGCGSKAKGPAAANEEERGPSPKGTVHPEDSGKRGGNPAGKTTEKTASRSTDKPKSAEKPAEKSEEKPVPKVAAVAGGGTIRLIDRGCVSFEPHWTTIRVGQSLTWRSELKKTVTIHVPPGAFDRTEYIVPARRTVHTGPAQSPGDHAIWTMPSACQAAPLGVQGAGPGVTVEGR